VRKLTDRLLAGEDMPDRFWCFGDDGGSSDGSSDEGQGHPGLSDDSASNTQGMAGPSTGPTGDSGSGGFDDDNFDPSFSPPTPGFGFGDMSFDMPNITAGKVGQKALGMLASMAIGGLPGLAIGTMIGNAPLGQMGEPQGHPGLSDTSALGTQGMAGGWGWGQSDSPGGTDPRVSRQYAQQTLYTPPPSLLNPVQATPPTYGQPKQGYWAGNQFIIPPYGLLG